MKRFWIAGAFALSVGGPALAADLPPPPGPMPRAPATYIPAAVPYYNWTGFYIGGNLGGAFNQGSYSDPTGNTFSAANSFKFAGGGQIGANYEFANGALIGVEAMFDWFPNTSNTIAVTLGPPFAAGTAASATINNSWLTTVTGRLGYAWDRLLIYGKGGFAYVGASNSNVTIGGVGVQTAASSYGWTAGVGLEYVVFGNLSARVEYDYVGLTNNTFGVPAGVGGLGAPDQFTGNNRNIQLVTLGLNYKFGW